MKIIKELNYDSSEDLDEIGVDNTSLDTLGKFKSFKPIESDSKELENKNRQGLIRLIKGAHLVYKHVNATDRYDELWVYKTTKNGTLQDLEIKNDIISGTDIPLNSSKSADGEQEFEIWYSGNTVFLKISNLPN